MKQHAHVHSVKGAVLGHNDFAAAAFSAGQPNTVTFPPSSSITCAAPHRRPRKWHHDIVAAGMPHAFHRIELTENGDIRAFLSGIIHAFHWFPVRLSLFPRHKPYFSSSALMDLQAKILFEIVFRIIPQIIGQPAQLRQESHPPGGRILSLICLHVRPHHFFILGSSTSRTPSPSRLKPQHRD